MNYTKGNWEIQQQKNLASGRYEFVIKIKDPEQFADRVIATMPYANLISADLSFADLRHANLHYAVKYNDHEANAHLISAAPDMYEALNKIVIMNDNLNRETMEIILNALQKAEGK